MAFPLPEGWEQGVEKVEAEILTPLKQQQQAKMDFVHKFWPTATPMQVFISFMVGGFLLTKILKAPRERVEIGLEEISKRLVFWDKPKPKRRRKK